MCLEPSCQVGAFIWLKLKVKNIILLSGVCVRVEGCQAWEHWGFETPPRDGLAVILPKGRGMDQITTFFFF